MLYRGLSVRDGICSMVDKVIPIILTETARRNTNTECTLHFCLDLRDTILIAFVGIARQKCGVVFLRVMRFQPCAIEGIKGDANSMAAIETIRGGVLNDLPYFFSRWHTLILG